MGEAAEVEHTDDSLQDLADAWSAVEGENDDAEIQREEPESSEEVWTDGDDTIPADPPTETGEDQGGAPSEPDDQPPVSWNASARESWKDLPKETRDYIHQREQQMQDGLRKNAEAAKQFEGMRRTLAPYQQLFAINGGPSKTLPGLLQTAATLQMGSPQQKAETVKNLISQFGVDIRTLDSMLVGEAPPQEVQQASQLEQMLNQKLAPLQEFVGTFQQQQAAQAHAQQAEVHSELDTFAADPKNEFYRDVRMDMADFLERAAAHGQSMSLEQAYERACHMNPQISEIIQSRNSRNTVAQKRQAASSISGNLGGQGDQAGSDTRLGALQEAWDNAGRT